MNDPISRPRNPAPALTPAQWALAALFLAAVFLGCVNDIGEPDPFFHVKAGEWIWRAKAIPRADVFSYTAEGRPWVAHEWLAEVLFYGLYAALGFRGLILFSAAVAAFTYGLMLLRAVRRGADPRIALLLLPLAGNLTFSFWTPRPQIFSFLFCALLLILIDELPREPRRTLPYLALLFLLWTNLHGGVVIGLGLLGLFALSDGAGRWLSPPPARGKPPSTPASCWPAAVVLAAAASLANPSGYRVWTYLFAVRPAARALGVLEWQSILAWREPLRWAFLLVVAAVSAFLAYWRALRPRSRDAREALPALAVSVLPLVSLRHASLWPIVVFPPLALAASEALGGALRRMTGRALEAVVAAAGIGLTAGEALALPAEYYKSCCVAVHAADFLEASGIAGPLFNDYNSGGYLIFRLWPRQRVFIDGRLDVYGPEQIRDYEAILGAGANWDELVNRKYRLNCFLLDYRPPSVLDSLRPLCARLVREGWALVYWDDASLVYVRNDPRNAALIRRYALRHVSPLRDPAAIPPGERAEAARELRSLLLRVPRSVIVGSYARDFFRGG